MTVLVTGASRGIGLAVSASLAEAGAFVLGVYRRTIGGLAQLPSTECMAIRADLGTDRGIDAVAAGCGRRSLTGVVHAAGVAVTAPFESGQPGETDPIRFQLKIDLESPLLLTRKLLAAGRIRSGCSIVFISSNLARVAGPGKTAYGAAKAGVEGAVRGLARELGPQGIRVNGVAPGLIETDMTADRSKGDLAAYAAEVPLGRVGQPADVAEVVGFLLGQDANFISGQILDVDGGWGL